jgi:sortase (surface protein transpeptidase)
MLPTSSRGTTMRLGTPGNIVVTGHYYWGGLPALFADLTLLAPRDVIELTAAGDTTYRYAVASVRTYDKATAPLQEIVGPTGEETLTLITDGGDLSIATGEFLGSTVVRATRAP